jgi:hypothetical protein
MLTALVEVDISAAAAAAAALEEALLSSALVCVSSLLLPLLLSLLPLLLLLLSLLVLRSLLPLPRSVRGFFAFLERCPSASESEVRLEPVNSFLRSPSLSFGLSLELEVILEEAVSLDSLSSRYVGSNCFGVLDFFEDDADDDDDDDDDS